MGKKNIRLLDLTDKEYDENVLDLIKNTLLISSKRN